MCHDGTETTEEVVVAIQRILYFVAANIDGAKTTEYAAVVTVPRLLLLLLLLLIGNKLGQHTLHAKSGLKISRI